LDPLDSLRSALAAFGNCLPGEELARAREIFDLLDDDIRQWWRFYPHSPDGTQGPTFETFHQELLRQLLPPLKQLRNPKTFPFLFMGTLERAMQQVLDTHGAAEPKSTKAQQLLRRQRASFSATFVSRTMVRWFAPQLGPRQRQALELRFLHEMSFEAIASAMNYRENNPNGARSAVKLGISKVRYLALADARGLKPRTRMAGKAPKK
jgi:hypothetical protein